MARERETLMHTEEYQGPPAVTKAKHVTNCAVCSRTLLSPALEFPGFPLTNLFFKNREKWSDLKLDLGLCLCPNCGHAQLDSQVDPGLAYGEGFIFRSSSSPGQLIGIDNFFSFTINHLRRERCDTIIELGCNDLHLLKRFTNRANRLFGIDPICASQDGETVGNNITVIGKYAEDVDLIEALDHKIPDVVLSRHTLEHIREPKKIIQKFVEIATPETLFIFEFPSFEETVRNLRYNQIFHEHLHYWTLKSFAYLLEDFGCGIEHVAVNDWGAGTSLIVSFRLKEGRNRLEKEISLRQGVSPDEVREGFLSFKDQMRLVKRQLDSIESEKVCGYGAAVAPPVLAYYLGTDFQFLEVIWDDDIEKNGLWYSNLPVPIKHPRKDLSLKEYHVIITEPDAARPIISRLKQLQAGQIILPRLTL